jgi:membrane protein implicated in regulation of membrane protease activity
MALVVALLLAVFVLQSPWSYVVVGAAAVFEVGETWFWWWLSHRRKPSVGVETLVGRSATVASACRPRGQVRVAGELWQAVCTGGAELGDVVRVVEVNGLELVVER